MTRDPYGGSIWDPASLHRYNYARANPVNYIDPSGRADLTEYEFALVDVLPTIGEVAFVGQQVACDYSVMASILDIIFDAPYANGEQMQLASIQLDKSLGKCGVKATWQGNLLNIGLILASYDFGPLFGDAEEGFAICRLCFAAGTPVHTERGAVPIEKIKVGDKVWARSERTGATELRKVTAIAPQHFDKLMELRIAGEKKALHPTPTHPFWARRKVGEAAHWIEAADLIQGMQLLAQDGRWLTIASVAALDKPAVVYNFTVEEDHDYFVGLTGVLVHNALCSLPRGGVYVLKDADGNVWRTGRTVDLAAREAQHALNPLFKNLAFQTVFRTDSYAEQRGLEQILQDAYPNAPYNIINAISPSNPNIGGYITAALNYLNGVSQ